MADEVQLGAELASLLPVIVGGVIGVVGGLAGPPLTHWLSERAEKRRRKAEKFEEMLRALYDHQHWLMTLKDVRAFGDPDNHVPSPLPIAIAIAAIYFPQMKPALGQMELAASKFELWAAEAGKRRLEGNIASVNDGLMEAYQPYLDAFDHVIKSMRDYAMTTLKQ